ncbi:MAG: VOC family protein [Chitinophagaceae bacterium]|nr:VOC family protein [Chitinophagaceae bacterium]
MIKLCGIHHIAVICSDYERSKAFYMDVLGLELVKETYREQRESFKADLALNGKYVIELFSFPDPPKRLSGPEGTGLRHLAFAVENISETVRVLQQKNIMPEPVRMDATTGKKFTFIADPDELPIEFYEM